MPTRTIQVNRGDNLAALMVAFPNAEVSRLICNSDEDGWRITIDEAELSTAFQEIAQPLDRIADKLSSVVDRLDSIDRSLEVLDMTIKET